MAEAIPISTEDLVTNSRFDRKIALRLEQVPTHACLSVRYLDPKQLIGRGKHAGGRACVPGPAAAAAVAPAVVDVRRLLDGDQPIDRDPVRIPGFRGIPGFR